MPEIRPAASTEITPSGSKNKPPPVSALISRARKTNGGLSGKCGSSLRKFIQKKPGKIGLANNPRTIAICQAPPASMCVCTPRVLWLFHSQRLTERMEFLRPTQIRGPPRLRPSIGLVSGTNQTGTPLTGMGASANNYDHFVRTGTFEPLGQHEVTAPTLIQTALHTRVVGIHIAGDIISLAI